MTPAVRIVHHTITRQAQRALIFSRDAEWLRTLNTAVAEVLHACEVPCIVRTRDRIDLADGTTLRFIHAPRPDDSGWCEARGLRADVLFYRAWEWTREEVSCSLLPFLAGHRLPHMRAVQTLERRLMQAGWLHEEECWRRIVPVDDLLVDLDPR